MVTAPLPREPIPDLLATSIRLMAPAYLRRRLSIAGAPFRDRDTTTFVYVGEADVVGVKTFMALFPKIPLLERFEDSDVWTTTVRLPEKARVEYKLEVAHEGRIDTIVDPLNELTALDPFGVNSVAHGPGYEPPPWTSGGSLRPDAIDRVDVESAVFGRSRTVGVYRPPLAAVDDETPLVVIHDGSDLVTFADLRSALDGLVLGGHVAPFAAVLIDPIHRNREYTASAEHAAFVVEELLPAVRESLGVGGHQQLVCAGASLGAVASLATAWRNPGVFDDLVLLSGSFVTALGGPRRRGKLFEPVIAFMEEFAASSTRPAARIWMACGAYEGLSTDNQTFVPVLVAHGSEVSYREPADGHHWASWRNSLGEALIDLIGPG